MGRIIDALRGFLPGEDAEPLELNHVANYDEELRKTLAVHELVKSNDAFTILRDYRQDKIVFVKIHPEMHGNAYDMKQAINSFKKTTQEHGGAIFGLDGRWLIMLPKGVSLTPQMTEYDVA